MLWSVPGWGEPNTDPEVRPVFGFTGFLPDCGKYVFDVEVETPIFAAGTYCEGGAEHPEISQLLQFIEKTLSGRTILKLNLSFFDLSAPEFSRVLCRHLDHNTQSVILGTRRGNGDDLTVLKRCAESRAVPQIATFERGMDGFLASFHLKLLGIELDDGSRVTITGSVNPSRGHWRNTDYFLYFIEYPSQQDDWSPMFDYTGCIIKAVALEPLNSLDERLERRKIQGCSARSRERLKSWYGLVPFILPYDRDWLVAQLAFLAASNDTVRAYTQAGDYDLIVDTLVMARGLGHGVSVTMDDDTYYFHVNPEGRSTSRYLSDEAEELNFLLPLQLGGVEMRFVPTNHHDYGSGLGNFMHAKFVVFLDDGDIRASVVGSSNLTYAAYFANLESGFVVLRPPLLTQILEFSEEIDKTSIGYSGMPRRDLRPIKVE